MDLYDSDALTVSASPRSDPGCIFCKIVRGDIPAKAVHKGRRVIAIDDLNPQAPTHILVMPVEHFETLGDAAGADDALVSELFSVAAQLGREAGGPGGFRIVVNTGADGGQTVGHLHVHVLAGRPMHWPPG